MKKSHKKAIKIVSAVILCLALASGLIYIFAVVLPEKREKAEMQRRAEEYYAEKLIAYENENAEFEDYDADVAFLGDSLTDGYDLKKYFPQFVCVNRGISGETTVGLEKRLQVSVYDLKPKVVVMLIGANNMDTMLENYEDILIGLRDNLPETKVVLLSLTAMGGEKWGRKNQLAAYNNVSIKLLSEKYGFYYVDLFSALYDVNTGEVYEGFTVDGGHFTHEGYVTVTNEITPVLEEILQKAEGKE